MRFAVQALTVGRTEIPGPELFWMGEWDRWFPLSFHVVLVRGEGVTALVNTGAPADLAPLNQIWSSVLGERARFLRDDTEDIRAQLARVGVRPSDVTHVIATPFQLYTTAGIPLFANAQLCLSKRGWIHFHTTHRHPHDNRWTSISREVLVHLVTDAWDRVRLLADEEEIEPGLRTWWAGTHHRATTPRCAAA